jgi:hypothetical protein
MIAMDVDVCYKSIEIFLVLVWIKNSTSTANTVAPTAVTPKSRHVGKRHRAQFKPKLERFECFGRV